jgi:alpha-glucuronidase
MSYMRAKRGMGIVVSSCLLVVFSGIAVPAFPMTEDSSQLSKKSYQQWLQYDLLPKEFRDNYRPLLKGLYVSGRSPILINAKDEVKSAIEKMTRSNLVLSDSVGMDGQLVLGPWQSLKNHLPKELIQKAAELKKDGFLIRSVMIDGKKVTVITSGGETGVLYGAFCFLRLLQTKKPINSLNLSEEPRIGLRLLNHWDNLDGSIERGYAGKSLWKWEELPNQLSPRYRDYARYCASVGLNGTVLNNVNAGSNILLKEYLLKVKALADLFRTWGLKTYVSVNFAAPLDTSNENRRWRGIGGLSTADPLDQSVQNWWRAKAKEIYDLMPDFGGFLVKADAEGQPGPNHYNRTAVEGANMLADVLNPHGGTLIWRAFVYQLKDDRASESYDYFKPMDGLFKENVLLQVKNGPIDFQPREPFHPLFGAMPHTSLAMEFQITKEYLGQSATLTYLAPMWTEVLGSDTYAKGAGSIVAKVIDGTLHNYTKTCIAGVSNVGDNENWCGNDFNQANWYAFGRLSWNHRLSAEQIAEEWITMTFNCDDSTTTSIKNIMLGSYEACVSYSDPLGLNHMMEKGPHYKPNPQARYYYHRADSGGIGFDRTVNGSGCVNQYFPEVRDTFNRIDTIPLKFLLWFHHVPWGYKLKANRTLWEELNVRYNSGVEYVDHMYHVWKNLKGKVDENRYASVLGRLKMEKEYSRLWRDTCLSYFSELVQHKAVTKGLER